MKLWFERRHSYYVLHRLEPEWTGTFWASSGPRADLCIEGAEAMFPQLRELQTYEVQEVRLMWETFIWEPSNDRSPVTHARRVQLIL